MCLLSYYVYYGQNTKEKLKKIYEDRKGKLESSKILIHFEKKLIITNNRRENYDFWK